MTKVLIGVLWIITLGVTYMQGRADGMHEVNVKNSKIMERYFLDLAKMEEEKIKFMQEWATRRGY